MTWRYLYSGQGPIVIVDLDTIIGVVDGKLKFGGSKFSEKSHNSRIVYKSGANWLQAEVKNSQGVYVFCELKLDGVLMISVPDIPMSGSSGRRDIDDACCSCCCGN